MNTEEKILAKALEMFNERGIEYVGLRELAATLDMRVSNITYYFPTKDDLVDRLSIGLNELNSSVFVHNPHLGMEDFLAMLKSVFYNHLKYRCLLLSFVHLMEQNKKMAARYKKTQTDRYATLRLNLQTLLEGGYLLIKDEREIDFLLSTLSLITRFWISEAQISFSHLNPEQQVNHYLLVIARLLLPYSSEKGQMSLKLQLKNLDDTLDK